MTIIPFIVLVLSQFNGVPMFMNFNQLPDNHMMIVNDSVMGGLSTSNVTRNENGLFYNGNVSLENNGGFASLRMLWPFDVNEEFKKIKIHIKGDGKIYQFRLRTNLGFDGAAYVYEFKTTKDKWQTVEMELKEFVPSFRGRKLTNMPKLTLKDVKQMGVLIASYQTGDFEFKLKSIELVKQQ